MHHATLLANILEVLTRGWPIIVRHAEPGDYEALHRIFSGPQAIAGTLQLPLPSAELWRQRVSEPPEGTFSLVACVDDEVVGEISLLTTPTRWRTRHVASIGMAVRDDWRGKGVGTPLCGQCSTSPTTG